MLINSLYKIEFNGDVLSRSYVFREFSEAEHSKSGRLYEPRHIGGIFLPRALDSNFLSLLRHEVVGLDRGSLFEKDPEQVGVVRQNSFSLYAGGWGKGDTMQFQVVMEDLPFSCMLASAYASEVYNPIASAAGLPQIGDVNSLNFRRYPANSLGLGYHLDSTSGINLVGVVSVEGDAIFSLASSRQGHGEISYRMRPGDMMLMRANPKRGKSDPDIRPFHSVRILGADRYSLVLRNRSDA
jgi:hypothetical protein